MGRKIILVAVLTCNGIFCRPCLFISIQVRRNIYFLLLTLQICYPLLSCNKNDASDKFMNAHNDLALPEFGPFYLKKKKTNIHVVLIWWRLFGFKHGTVRRDILNKTTALDFCIGWNSIIMPFKTCSTQCTVHVLPRVFCKSAKIENWVCELYRSYETLFHIYLIKKSRISQYFSYFILYFPIKYNIWHIIVCGKRKTPKV